MLDIGWVFASGIGLPELIVLLSRSPYESIFNTDLVQALYEVFGWKFKKAILIRCLVPYLVYLVITLVFFTLFTSAGINSFSE